MKERLFRTEADLCAAYADEARAAGWVVYPETAGFDMLMVRPEGDAHAGVQIGVEAKLTLNAKVAAQILDSVPFEEKWERGPDYRVALVGSIGGAAGIATLLQRCGVVVVAPHAGAHEGSTYSYSHLWPTDNAARPSRWQLGGDARCAWFDWNPKQRCELPEFVPTVAAGVPAPLQLSRWKIGALRVVAHLQIHGSISPAEIKQYGCDPSRWCRGPVRWLDPAARGRFARGGTLPRFEDQHPDVYAIVLAELTAKAAA